MSRAHPRPGFWSLGSQRSLGIRQNRNFSPDLSRPGGLPALAASPGLWAPFPQSFPRRQTQIPARGESKPSPSALLPSPPFSLLPPHLPQSEQQTSLLPQPRPGVQGRDRGCRGGAGGAEEEPGAGAQSRGLLPGRARCAGAGSRLLLRRRAGDAAAGPAPGAPRSPAPRRGASGHPRWARGNTGEPCPGGSGQGHGGDARGKRWWHLGTLPGELRGR